MAAPAEDPPAENPSVEENEQQSNEQQDDQKEDAQKSSGDEEQRIHAIHSDDEFDETITLLKGKMVLIDFTATWYDIIYIFTNDHWWRMCF